MSKKFKAVNRFTGEEWKPDKSFYKENYLVMYDSGYLAEVRSDGYYTSIVPLCTKTWYTKHQEKPKGMT